MSLNDSDLWAFSFDDDSCEIQKRNLIFGDVTSSWDTFQASMGFVGGAPSRYVIAMTRRFSAISSAIRIHLHDPADETQSSSIIALSPRAGMRDQNVDVGGSERAGFNYAMLAYEAVNAQGLRTVTTAVVDTLLGTVSPASPISSQGSADSAHPAINRALDAVTYGWIVAYQEYNSLVANDEWSVLANRVDVSRNVLGTWSPRGFRSGHAPATPQGGGHLRQVSGDDDDLHTIGAGDQGARADR